METSSSEIPVLAVSSDDDWVAFCGVCEEGFAISVNDAPDTNPYPYGVFCPDCRANKLKAPGVLNFRRRKLEP